MWKCKEEKFDCDGEIPEHCIRNEHKYLHVNE